MQNKNKIDAQIADYSFPTPKKVIWQLKQDGIILSEEERDYTFRQVQSKLEDMMMTLRHPVQISVVNKFLQRNYDDWNEHKTTEDDKQVIINFNLTNDSENKI